MATIKTSGGGTRVNVRLGVVSCRCFTKCPTEITGNMCGLLVDCVLSARNGTTVEKTVLFDTPTCGTVDLNVSWDFGFTADEVQFYAKTLDTSEQFVGTTGCKGGEDGARLGSVIITLPNNTVGLRALSIYGCGRFPNNLGSIDGLNIVCVP